jgi:hypothetical protein
MIRLFGDTDITSYRRDVKDSAQLSDAYGRIVRERQYRLNDPISQYNPVVAGSLLDRNWRNASIEEFDKFGNLTYRAAINDVGFVYADDGRATLITARDTFGVLKDWSVEEYSLLSGAGLASYYRSSLNRARQYAGNITLTAVGTPPPLSAANIGNIVSFEPDIVPRYQIVTVPSSTSFTLDRPLEFDITYTTVVRIMAPTVKTGPAAVRDALLAAGVTNLNTSFNVLDAQDAAAGLQLRLFVRKEQKTKLTDHLNTILDMTDLFLTVNSEGQVGIIRGLQYDGTLITREITDKEIILPLTVAFDKSKLYFAYDCLYYSSGKVAVTSGTVSNDLLNAYAARERWQPVSASSESPLEYRYLYATQAAADYFGNRRISYNGLPRVRVSCSLKRAPSGRPNEPYNLTIGDKFLLSCSFGGGRGIEREPAVVVGYEYDDEKQYYSRVELELSNYLFPELPVP